MGYRFRLPEGRGGIGARWNALRTALHAALRRHPRRWIAIGAAALAVTLGVVAFVRFAGRVEALRARRASGPAWAFPSRLYSAGVPFVAGRPLPGAYLREQLAWRGYRLADRPLRTPGTWTPIAGGVEIYLRGFRDAPDPAGHGGPERVRLALNRGMLQDVGRLGGAPGGPPPDLRNPPRLEPILCALLFDEHRMRRTWVPLKRIPPVVRNAVIAAEDRRFYHHFGLDVRSNFRALFANLRARGLREGASTITQQLARGLFLGSRRSWDRKLREIAIALGLEALLSKDEILEMYLNSIYWGRAERGGIGGVAEAARWYFDRPVESLGLPEAALLAGLIPAPNSASPFRDPRLARARRAAVLRDMVANGVLSAREAARVARAPLGVRRGPPPPERFPSYAGYVREALRPLGREVVERGGLAIFTALDPVWQAEAETRLADEVAAIERWRGRLAQPLEGAFVAIDPATGYVRALVGGCTPRPGDFNRAFQARRQPGSAIKPLVYAAALDNGNRRGAPFTPASTVPDLRREFVTPQGPWQPRNDEGDYHPEVTLAKALAKSLNVATANLVEAVGPAEVARYAARFGLQGLRAVPSIGLGTSEVTLLELTSAYAAFPNQGVRRAPTPIRAVLDGRGRMVARGQTRAVRVMPAQVASLMTGLLEDVVIFGVSYPLRARYGFYQPLGGKTGTTNDYNDAWFVGFTPDVTAGVWIGYDVPQSLRRPAAETALATWAGIMQRLLDGYPPRPFDGSDGLELVWIDPWTGGLARSDCPRPMRVPFLSGSAPRSFCQRDHEAEWIAIAEAQRLADSLAAEQESVQDSLARVPFP